MAPSPNTPYETSAVMQPEVVCEVHGLGKVQWKHAPEEPAGIQDDHEREAQKKYWEEHTPANPTVETMMLDSKAGEIDRRERPEVLGLLGCVKGKRVLEIGAGIGRFTGELCRAGAARVHAVDFMAASIEENKRLHAHLYPDQLTLQVEDATKMQEAPGSYDVIFTNWLLMYLNDQEVKDLAQRMLTWLAPGGVLFFRESCFKQSGDKPRKDNPSHYRNPRDYFAAFDSAKQVAPGGAVGNEGSAAPKEYQFELLLSKCVDTYVQLKNNQSQICWKWRKVVIPEAGCSHRLRHFLDASQYSMKGLELYEAAYGRGFISCGGEAAAREFIPLLNLNPEGGSTVLDVGCGTGGAASLMSREFKASVHGLDLSVNCLLTCLERAKEVGCDIVYEVADISRRSFPAASFNAIHCRDVMLHVDDKPALLSQFQGWLKPEGKLLITDYGIPDCNASSDVEAVSEMGQYIADRKYSLFSCEQYKSAVQAAGFTDVQVTDCTDKLVAHLSRELQGLISNQQELSEKFGRDAIEKVVASWKGKLARAQGGAQKWILVIASKA